MRLQCNIIWPRNLFYNWRVCYRVLFLNVWLWNSSSRSPRCILLCVYTCHNLLITIKTYETSADSPDCAYRDKLAYGDWRAVVPKYKCLRGHTRVVVLRALRNRVPTCLAEHSNAREHGSVVLALHAYIICAHDAMTRLKSECYMLETVCVRSAQICTEPRIE